MKKIVIIILILVFIALAIDKTREIVNIANSRAAAKEGPVVTVDTIPLDSIPDLLNNETFEPLDFE